MVEEIGRVNALLALPPSQSAGSVRRISVETANANENVVDFSPSAVPIQEFRQQVQNIVCPIVDSVTRDFRLQSRSFRVSIQNTDRASLSGQISTVSGLSEGLAVLLAMLSALLDIPISDRMAFSASLADIGGSLGPVRLKGKLSAAYQSGMETVIVCSPEPTHAPVGFEEKVLRENEEEIQRFRSAMNIVKVTHLGEVFPIVFKPHNILRFLVRNGFVNKGSFHVQQHLKGGSTFLNFVTQSGGRFWEMLSNLVVDSHLDLVRDIFSDIVDYSYTYQHAYPTGIGMRVSALRRLAKNQEVFDPIRGMIPLDNWSKLARIASSDDLSDLLRILFDYEINEDSLPALVGNQNFQSSIRNLTLDALNESDPESIVRLISVLAHKLSLRVLVDDLFLEDLYDRIRNRFMDRLAASYAEGEKDLEVLLNNRAISSVSSLERVIRRTHNRFLRDLRDLFFILDKVLDVSPLLALRIASEDFFMRLASRIRDAHHSHQIGKVTPTSLLHGREIATLLDVSTFWTMCPQLEPSNDEIVFAPRCPCLIIRTSKDLSSLNYDWNENNPQRPSAWREGNTIKDPVLMYQDSSSLCEYWKAPDWEKDKCELLGLPDGHLEKVDGEGNRVKSRGLIQHFFGNENSLVEYDGTEVVYPPKLVWPPSIDTFFTCAALEERSYFADASYRKIWDLGTGTGFLGIHFAKCNRSVRYVLFSDLTARHDVLVRHNVSRNLVARISGGLKCDVMIAGDFGFPPREEFDLIICTPPYLPCQDVYLKSAKIESPTHGTDLLEKIVVKGGQYTKKLVIEFSSVAMEEFKRRVDETGAMYRELSRKSVPFRVSPVAPVSPEELVGKNWMEHPERARLEADYVEKRRYTDFLERERGLLPREGPEARNFKYWHDIVVYEIDYTARL